MSSSRSDIAADRACEKRMAELAGRAARTGRAQYSNLLSAAQMQQARICARQAGVLLESFGGFEDAERRVAAFTDMPDEALRWPVVCVRLGWDKRFDTLGHRDILGSLMSLGMDRALLGDIVMGTGEAHLFALPAAAKRVQAELAQAGGATLSVEILEEIPALSAGEGEPVRGTVASLRLDAVLDLAFRLSRGRAAELVKSGRVQVDHMLELRPDRKLSEGAVLSVRGIGRAELAEIGGQTKKDRTSVTLLRYGL